MQDVTNHNAEGDVDIEGKALAIHGDENGRLTHPQHCLRYPIIFIADDEAGFFGVGVVIGLLLIIWITAVFRASCVKIRPIWIKLAWRCGVTLAAAPRGKVQAEDLPRAGLFL
jgi:hypothetical protein